MFSKQIKYQNRLKKQGHENGKNNILAQKIVNEFYILLVHKSYLQKPGLFGQSNE